MCSIQPGWTEYVLAYCTRFNVLMRRASADWRSKSRSVVTQFVVMTTPARVDRGGQKCPDLSTEEDKEQLVISSTREMGCVLPSSLLGEQGEREYKSTLLLYV